MDQLDGLRATMSLAQLRRFGNLGDPSWSVLHHVCLCQHLWTRMGYPFSEIGYVWTEAHRDAATGDMPAHLKAKLDLGPLNIDIEKKLFKELKVIPPSDETQERLAVIAIMALIFEAMYFGPQDYRAFAQFSDGEERRWFERLAKCLPEHVDRLAEYFFACTGQQPPSVWLPGTHGSERLHPQLDAPVVVHALPERGKNLLNEGDR